MITIKPEIIAAEQDRQRSALAKFEEKKGQYASIQNEWRAAVDKASELSELVGKTNIKRKELLVEAGGKITKAVIGLRNQLREQELELEDVVMVQGELKTMMDDMLPELHQLAAEAFRAREAVARVAVASLKDRKAELIRELGLITALELKVPMLGTPFDALNHWRFGDGTPVEVIDSKVSTIAAHIKSTADNAEGTEDFLREAGVSDIDIGPLDESKIGSPLAGRIRRRA